MNKRSRKKRAKEKLTRRQLNKAGYNWLLMRLHGVENVVVRFLGQQVEDLEKLVHAQHEHIEDLGNQVAELKRLVKQNTEATNNQLESLDGKIKKVADGLVIKTAKKSFWKK